MLLLLLLGRENIRDRLRVCRLSGGRHLMPSDHLINHLTFEWSCHKSFPSGLLLLYPCWIVRNIRTRARKEEAREVDNILIHPGWDRCCISISSISSFWQIGKEVVLGIAGASLLWLEDATLVMGYLVILAPTVEIPAIRVWLICLSCDYKRRWLRLWSSLWQVQEAQWYLSWAWHRLVEDGEKGNELVNVKILVVIITSSLRPSY